MIFKYFHGTSTIFLDSIRKYGLGSINPNIDYKNLDVLQFLFYQCELHLLNNPNYLQLRDTSSLMVNQSASEVVNKFGQKQILNYKHDGIYVGLSRERAAIYAVLNKYGSEILERCIDLYQILLQSDVPVDIPKEIDIFNFRQFINKEYKPIIIEVSDISDKQLEKEDGSSAIKELNLLRKEIPKMNEKEKFEYLQFCNYKLLTPIDPYKLKFFEIEHEGNPREGNFEFTLSLI